MQQEQLSSELTSLERKLKLLLNEYHAQKEELTVLQSENDALKSTLKEKEDLVSSFQNQLKISSIVNNISVDGVSTTELKQQINSYIKEIDKCIAYLSE